MLSRERARPVGNFRLVQGPRARHHAHHRLRAAPRARPGPARRPSRSSCRRRCFETTALWLRDARRAAPRRRGSATATSWAGSTRSSTPPSRSARCSRCATATTWRASPTRGTRSSASAAIFLYDGAPGRRGARARASSSASRRCSRRPSSCVADCECEDGCPSCVHSPQVRQRQPPDRQGGARATCSRCCWRASRCPPARSPSDAPRPGARRAPSPAPAPAAPALPRPAVPRSRDAARRARGRRLAQRAPDAGGPRGRLRGARASASRPTARRDGRGAARAGSRAADLVVGFNVRRFDYRVLRGYTDLDLARSPTFDLLDAIHGAARLPALRSATSARRRSAAPRRADGLQSLRWWQEGRVDEIERYCRADVAILRDLFRHAARARAPAVPHQGAASACACRCASTWRS